MNHIQSPATGDQAIERAIVSAGANVAPRVTPADIEAAIVSAHYFTAEDGRAGAIEAEARRRGYTVGVAEYSDRVTQHFAVAEHEIDALEALAAEASAGAALVVRGAAAYVDLAE